MKRTLPLVAILLALFAVLGQDRTASAARTDPAEQVLEKAIGAALQNDFKAYLALVHPNEKATPQQVTQLERYTFGRFVRQVGWYLEGTAADSFKVERREDLGGGKVRLFLKDVAHPSRAPVPVSLEQQGATFVILSNSL